MAHTDDLDRGECPIHVSKVDELPVHPGSGSGASLRAGDGPEQPHLDDSAQRTHGHGGASEVNEPTHERQIGQFTGEGQPSRQKK